MRLSLVLLFAFVVAFTFAVHEGAHWAMGEALGYDMWVRVNSAGLASGAYANEWHAQIVSAAGPATTILQGVIAYAVINRWGSVSAFAFLLSAFLMRVLAAVASLRTPNDEARIGIFLGVGPWLLFAVVIGFLFLLVVLAVRRLKLGWGTIGLSLFCWTVFMSVVIVGERYLPGYNVAT